MRQGYLRTLAPIHPLYMHTPFPSLFEHCLPTFQVDGLEIKKRERERKIRNRGDRRSITPTTILHHYNNTILRRLGRNQPRRRWYSLVMESTLPDLTRLAASVISNLTNQHDWIKVTTPHDPPVSEKLCRAIRPLLWGLPPRRLYIHPDEQIAALQGGVSSSQISQEPEAEWVLPVHIKERLSLADFAAVFDSIAPIPPVEGISVPAVAPATTDEKDWRGSGRRKRILLAVVHDDSTVSYYIMHDGIVKPRQN